MHKKLPLRWVPPPTQLPDLLSTSSFYHDSFCVSLISPNCYFVINCTGMVKQAREGKGKQKTFALSVAGIPPCSNRGSRSPGTFSPHASRQPSPKGSAELGNPRLHTTVSIQAENVMSFLKRRTLSSHKDPFRNPFLPVPTARALDFGCFALFLNSSVRPRSRLERRQ